MMKMSNADRLKIIAQIRRYLSLNRVEAARGVMSVGVALGYFTGPQYVVFLMALTRFEMKRARRLVTSPVKATSAGMPAKLWQ